MPLVILLASGCYVATDYEKYPAGRFVSAASLVRTWKAGAGALELRRDAKFTASRLKLEYFGCSRDGVREKDGAGTWSNDRGRRRSEVLLRFDDGCTTSLWAGAVDGRTVLWSEYGDSGRLVTLT
ncbi:hypothetical protein ACFPC0_30270 [Streptomyces andamanensis]|uniref:DUF2690 domain-containing protein n=1 Tax=Streptomyces andamanensis TaxID=1565035 RepID=A0ABV8TMX3_9ACTN